MKLLIPLYINISENLFYKYKNKIRFFTPKNITVIGN